MCKVFHYTLRFYQSLSMCLLGVCYESHTILGVMKLTPGASIALYIIIKWYHFNIPYVTYSSQEPRDRNRCVHGPFSKSVFEITVRQPPSEEGLESWSSDGFISCQTLFFCLFRNSFHTFFLCVCA